ncbi:hypothetical protein LMH87_001442 [Akanthomyces muscarius]|uniref:Major facilitator superfamily (MFS) profile domain-containing protein n=1 Tax=Akanthomyces muscarius TaxID=2231603 RepID=A0A9W8Q6G0_AKAMU|nr:hypothetical protein LMH87_001442 [Akanthomyces muscarius]KAJ4146883.1 hypothetical protein LMH87_001442 [Akanthomyces muscarius]
MPLQDFNAAKMTSKANISANMTGTANTASAATPHHAAPETPSSFGDHDLKKGFNAREKFQKPLKFHLAFLSILLMVFIVSIDATALAVIPAIAEEFDGTYLQAFWANASFLLVVTVVLPVYTGLSEVVGRKIPLYAAFFLFTAGSVLFATAQSLPVLILARALQGSGCGGIDVLNEILVADITTLRERAFYIGLVSIPFALGSVLGPVVGALLGEYASWRWIGWINLPLVALCLPLSIFCLALKPLEGGLVQQLAGFDWCGLALFVVGAVALTLPLSWVGAMYTGDSWRTLLPLFVNPRQPRTRRHQNISPVQNIGISKVHTHASRIIRARIVPVLLHKYTHRVRKLPPVGRRHAHLILLEKSRLKRRIEMSLQKIGEEFIGEGWQVDALRRARPPLVEVQECSFVQGRIDVIAGLRVRVVENELRGLVPTVRIGRM